MTLNSGPTRGSADADGGGGTRGRGLAAATLLAGQLAGSSAQAADSSSTSTLNVPADTQMTRSTRS